MWQIQVGNAQPQSKQSKPERYSGFNMVAEVGGPTPPTSEGTPGMADETPRFLGMLAMAEKFSVGTPPRSGTPRGRRSTRTSISPLRPATAAAPATGKKRNGVGERFEELAHLNLILPEPPKARRVAPSVAPTASGDDVQAQVGHMQLYLAERKVWEDEVQTTLSQVVEALKGNEARALSHHGQLAVLGRSLTLIQEEAPDTEKRLDEFTKHMDEVCSVLKPAIAMNFPQMRRGSR